MKRLLIASIIAAAAAAPALAADVGVSINIGEPGFYGRLDIGGYPQPQLMYPQPIMIERVQLDRPPIYLRVPPGHAKDWKKHCREYNACGERVYFVQDNWYNREYAPRYREHHGKADPGKHWEEKGKGEDRHDKGKGDERHDKGKG
jgi:hypothetical protein